NVLIVGLSHRLIRIIKFVFLHTHALLARFLNSFEYLLRFIDAAWVPLQFHPSLTVGYFPTEGVLKGLQKFHVTGVERLQSAWALKLQSPRFSHQCGTLSERDFNLCRRPKSDIYFLYRKPYTSAQCVRSSGDSSTLTMIK